MAGTSRDTSTEPSKQSKNAQKFDIMICDDLTSGKEKLKIPVYNGNNNDKITPDYEYLNRCFRFDKHTGTREFCNCLPGECSSNRCSCWAASEIRIKVRIFIGFRM